MLNETQAIELFEREAVLVGTHNGVPAYRAAELFGPRAAGFATSPGVGQDLYGLFGIGDFQLAYLTRKGFQYAASFANVEELSRVAACRAWADAQIKRAGEDDS